MVKRLHRLEQKSATYGLRTRAISQPLDLTLGARTVAQYSVAGFAYAMLCHTLPCSGIQVLHPHCTTARWQKKAVAVVAAVVAAKF